MSYKVRTKTQMEGYKQRHMDVIRRFRDFAWLKHRLQEQNRGARPCSLKRLGDAQAGRAALGLPSCPGVHADLAV